MKITTEKNINSCFDCDYFGYYPEPELMHVCKNPEAEHVFKQDYGIIISNGKEIGTAKKEGFPAFCPYLAYAKNGEEIVY